MNGFELAVERWGRVEHGELGLTKSRGRDKNEESTRGRRKKEEEAGNQRVEEDSSGEVIWGSTEPRWKKQRYGKLHPSPSSSIF